MWVTWFMRVTWLTSVTWLTRVTLFEGHVVQEGHVDHEGHVVHEGGMGQFGAAVSAMDVSAMKCEMCFLLECHQSALPSSGKHVSARFGLALVPGRFSHAIFNGIHDAYIVLLCFVLSSSKILANGEVHWLLTLKIKTKTTSFVGDRVLAVINLCAHDMLRDVDNHTLQWHMTCSQSHKYPLKHQKI